MNIKAIVIKYVSQEERWLNYEERWLNYEERWLNEAGEVAQWRRRGGSMVAQV